MKQTVKSFRRNARVGLRALDVCTTRTGEAKYCVFADMARGFEREPDIRNTAEIGPIHLLAPRRDQRDAEDIFEKMSVGLVVFHDIGVVVQPQASPAKQVAAVAKQGTGGTQ